MKCDIILYLAYLRGAPFFYAYLLHIPNILSNFAYQISLNSANVDDAKKHIFL